ncbi:hypothetical protein VTI74DRAFT_3126 [Chaetomium olivicolor]
MRRPRCENIVNDLERIDTVVGYAGAALLCAVLVQRLPTTQSGEVVSELLCWVILPAVLNRTKQWRRTRMEGPSRLALSAPADSRSASTWSLWMASAALAAACCYRAEAGAIWAFPALGPILLVADKKLRGEPGTESVSAASLCARLSNTTWGTTLVALSAVFALAD